MPTIVAFRTATTYAISLANIRCLWTFQRTLTPPLQEPKESPYIVGPYLKPDYLPTKYITEPIKDDVNDDDHKIYKPTHIIEDEERKIKLLLLNDVEGLGIRGEVIDVPFRYGASKLIAMGKADYATEFNLKWYKFDTSESRPSASSALSPITVRNLRDRIYDLPIAEGAEIQPWHISLALRLAQVQCPLYAIRSETIQSYTENGKEYVKCTIVVNNHENVTVRFRLPTKRADGDEDEELDTEVED